ncbi:hypothetical protein AX17_000909 [Amanita inopinata Kibby_2008]|nr:hypothetical protein AX17_000909 [Amanita inopinata Kibby_2008]
MDSPEAQRCPRPGDEPSHFRHAPIRLALFTAVLLPVVLVPYLLTRRRTLALRQRVDELQSTTKALQHELDAALVKLSARKQEHQRMRALLDDVVENSDHVQHQVEGLAAESTVARQDLHRLLADAQPIRAQTAALRALGTSLADIAAFMHEIELEMGIQSLSRDSQRRVDRLRILALRLENLPPISQQPSMVLKQ